MKKTNLLHGNKSYYESLLRAVLELLDALFALSHEGTTFAAATKLRVSQSTVSKRLRTLEQRLGRRLHEPVGRGCRLTPAGEALVLRCAPLVAALRAELQADHEERAAGLISLACSESILASWGAPVFAKAAAGIQGLELELHAHRSPLAVERVRAGRCVAALVAGDMDPGSELVVRVLAEEEMLLLPSGLQTRGVVGARTLPVWTIEEGSSTWRALRPRLRRRRCLPKLEIVGRLESFTALVGLARAGLGNVLVPRGIAQAMGITSRQRLRLLAGGAGGSAEHLSRPIAWVLRPMTAALERVARFETQVVQELRRSRSAFPGTVLREGAESQP